MPYQILVVDDEPDMESLVRQKLRRQIRNHEFEFLFCRNGEEALQTLASHPGIDLVLTDINMPVMTGPELLRALKTQPEAVRARVVISTDGSDARKAEVSGLNVDWYLEKPLRPEVMRDVLSKVAERVHG